jgi:hypothetical protein
VADFVKAMTVTANGQPAGNDLSFPNYFQDAELGYIQHPAALIDRHGRVMTWDFLPAQGNAMANNAKQRQTTRHGSRLEVYGV